MSDYLTEAQAAERLHVCTRTLRRIRQSGAIRFVAVTARTILYRPEDIEAFVEQRARLNHIPEPRKSARTNQKRKDGPVVVSFTARRAQRGGTG